MEFVGVNSIFVVVLTGAFTGGVFTLQTYHGFSMFGAGEPGRVPPWRTP